MTITIKTRLNDGVYQSVGGGEVRTHYTYKNGPRNLIAAIAQLWKHQQQMEGMYGNIGCGRSWLEIDGQEINPYDLQATYVNDADMLQRGDHVKTRTDKAHELLAAVQSGYNHDQYAA